ncbi:DMT family transporter [Ancylobacter mangrovi]|uniref:DMT family transporter n=1 Tax=Ancylobacter mangrovi TaxID=2972472 RepID=A0A9X2P875_9HYPH|nr:DMT family transporter [Ancylobacter mangrovi]MCS0493811.1 DMT family transporter [Ancylobacter mangrovi]MCS0501492.1 DMT family transporter [Ancylobacter mangrovi]
MSSLAETGAKPAVPLTGYVFGATGAILFASKGIIIKLAYAQGLDPETVLALRMVFALPFYLVIGAIAIVRMRAHGEAMPSLSVVGRTVLVGALGYWFASYMDFIGLEYISASFERLILFTYPLFVVLLGALFFRQPIRARALLAFAVAYSGLAIIFMQNFAASGNDTLRGVAFVAMSAISFALYQLLAGGLLRSIGSALFTCIAMTSAAVASLVQFALFRPIDGLFVSGHLLVLALMIAIGATVLPTFFLNAALKRISPSANSMISTVSPVATMGLAFVFLGETVSLVELVGSVLVMGGIGAFTFADARRR